MKYKFKSNWNADEFPRTPEANTLPSETIPDMTLSIRDILDRHKRGELLQGRKGEYDEDDGDDDSYYMPLKANLDLAEKEELLRAAKEEVARIKSIIQEKVNEKRDQEKKDAVEKQRKEWEERQLKPWEEKHRIRRSQPDEKEEKNEQSE